MAYRLGAYVGCRSIFADLLDIYPILERMWKQEEKILTRKIWYDEFLLLINGFEWVENEDLGGD